ncbi:MAG: DUF1538 domain-containing protein [Clostridiales bacterium]|jgi:hypothetical protein|nr:DUF1538 domain-containing protein [Clostridiales bacterium]
MKFLRTLKDVLISSLPLLAIVAIVCIFISPSAGATVKDIGAEEIVKLILGYIFVLVGQTLFLVGLDNSIMPIGKLVGGSLDKLKKPAFIIMFGFLFGLLATVAEPALFVLAGQVNYMTPEINRFVFIFVLGAGIGIFVAFALFRVIKNINLKLCFTVFYILTFALVFLVPPQYQALAFDASGATTGDVSVPFILALGLGVSATMSKSKTNDESFGIIGLASIGPIIAVFIYGLILGAKGEKPYEAISDNRLGGIIVENLGNVALALMPIIIIFLIFQFAFIKLPKKQLVRILAGSGVVYAGLLVFLSGIDFGFAFAGEQIGQVFMDPSRAGWFKWLMLPIGFFLGFAITLSEPAVVVLGEQVEEITNGHIKKTVMRITLSIGIGLAAFLSLLKILTGINILWFLIPLYAVALLLLIFTPKLFVGLAFDSGGVTGGAITSAFLTPMTLGASGALGQAPMTEGFGMIAFISVVPLIAVQLLGMLYALQSKRAQQAVPAIAVAEADLLDTLTAGGELTGLDELSALLDAPAGETADGFDSRNTDFNNPALEE